MPPEASEPEEQRRAELSAEDPWPDADPSPTPNGDEDPEDKSALDHDDLVALRSSRHVTRRPRRRRRWPWIALLAILVLCGLAYAFYLVGWDYVDDFLIERNITSAAAGYPEVRTSFSDGVASVSGAIGTQSDADALISSIEGLSGVTQVNADLRVGSASTSPLEQSILVALADAGITTVLPVIDGSIVTLTGSVREAALIDAASSIVVAVDGVSQVLNRLVVASDSASAAQQVLAAAGFASVTVETSGSIAVLTGRVPSEGDVLAAAEVVLGVPGIEKVDNRLEVGTVGDAETPEAPSGDAAELATNAVREAGFDGVTVSFDGTLAYIDGVVPLDVLEGGFFSYVDRVRSIVRDVGGAETVVNRMRLRGNEQELRAELQAILAESPIVFLSGSADLTIESQATLDKASEIILSQPGLQVFIAGHTDASGSADTNEQLARSRGETVYAYLVTVGVPANRMRVVSYGELFPGEGGSADDRRIEFEVGP